MNWSDVGGWIKKNAGPGAALVGSLLTGNAPGAIAAGVALVQSATGEVDADKALAALQDPATVLRLKELAAQEEQQIREHLQKMAEIAAGDAQAAHKEQQDTVRSGDNASDEYVRHTRPMMARQSWYAGAGYIIAFELGKVLGYFREGASMELAMVILAPAAAYLGFRTADKVFTKKAK